MKKALTLAYFTLLWVGASPLWAAECTDLSAKSSQDQLFRCIRELDARLANASGEVKAKKNVGPPGPCGFVCQLPNLLNFTGTCVGARVESGSAPGNYISCEQPFAPGDTVTCFCSRYGSQ